MQTISASGPAAIDDFADFGSLFATEGIATQVNSAAQASMEVAPHDMPGSSAQSLETTGLPTPPYFDAAASVAAATTVTSSLPPLPAECLLPTGTGSSTDVDMPWADADADKWWQDFLQSDAADF